MGVFPGVKRPGSGVDHPPLSSAEVEGRVELYICRPLGLRGLVGVNLTFYLTDPSLVEQRICTSVTFWSPAELQNGELSVLVETSVGDDDEKEGVSRMTEGSPSQT